MERKIDQDRKQIEDLKNSLQLLINQGQQRLDANKAIVKGIIKDKENNKQPDKVDKVEKQDKPSTKPITNNDIPLQSHASTSREPPDQKKTTDVDKKGTPKKKAYDKVEKVEKEQKPSTKPITHKEIPLQSHRSTSHEPPTQKKTREVTEKESPKKKAYNVRETREYMRKQKEKRIEQLKSQNVKETINQEDIRKKLNDLHRKSKQLVARNVEVSRARSKSREKNEYLRPQIRSRERSQSRDRKTFMMSDIPISRQRSVSRENINYLKPHTAVRGLSPSTEKVTVDSRCSRSKERKPLKMEPEIIKPALSLPNFNKDQKSKSAERFKTDSRITNKNTNTVKPKENVVVNNNSNKVINVISNITLRSANDEIVPLKPLENFSENSNIDFLKVPVVESECDTSFMSPKINLNSKPLGSKIKHSNEKLEKNYLSPRTNIEQKALKNKTPHSTKGSQFDKSLINSKADLECLEEVHSTKEHLKPLSISSIVSPKIQKPKDTKETQTSEQSKHEIAKITDLANADPLNFINTVKKKLHFATNMYPKSHNVGVQSSLKEDVLTKQKPYTVVKEDIKENLQKNIPNTTNLSSYVSHKNMNLDPKAFEHLQLNPHTSRLKSSKTKTETYNSESDTSKDIPEISTESGLSLQKNAQKNNTIFTYTSENPTINTEKLNNMKLKSKTSNIESTLNKIGTEIETLKHNTYLKPSMEIKHLTPTGKSVSAYSSDYNSESDLESSLLEPSPRSKSARESILSGNINNYSKRFSYSSSTDVTTAKELTVPEESSNIPTFTGSKSKQSTKKSIDTLNKGCSISKSKDFFSLTSLKETNSNINTLSEDTGAQISTMLSLKEPKADLRVNHSVKNISLRPKIEDIGSRVNSNDIHLKFEAEVHLLNDFNKSLCQLSNVEKAFESLKNKSETDGKRIILQNRDTQTSFLSVSSTNSKNSKTTQNSKISKNTSKRNEINYSRGSDIGELSSLDLDSINSSHISSKDSQMVDSLTGLELTKANHFDLTKSIEESNNVTIADNYELMNPAGMSLKLFEQLIKDEDVRLKNLKTILKIREHSLKDRMKTELLALEVQKKNLCQTGKVQEASALKKKQRGILINYSQEKHEMERLKNLHRVKSKERITKLKEERNLIKAQLSTDNMLAKIKVNTPRDKPKSGPMRVLSHTESVVSEMSFLGSGGEEVKSITSKSTSIVSKYSEVDEVPQEMLDVRSVDNGSLQNTARVLYARQADLEKRRKAAEELLEWHRKLLVEEARIVELEKEADNIIAQNQTEQLKEPTVKSTETTAEKLRYKGKALNLLWKSISGHSTKKFVEEKDYLLSEMALDRFYKSAREYGLKSKKVLKSSPSVEIVSDSAFDLVNIPQSETTISTDSVHTELSKSNSVINTEKSKSEENEKDSIIIETSEYQSESFVDLDSSSIVEIVSVKENNDQSKISSISQLIENLNKIDEEVSIIGKESQKSLDQTINTSGKNVSENSEQKIEEPSVILVEDSIISNWTENSLINLNLDTITSDISELSKIIEENEKNNEMSSVIEEKSVRRSEDSIGLSQLSSIINESKENIFKPKDNIVFEEKTEPSIPIISEKDVDFEPESDISPSIEEESLKQTDVEEELPVDKENIILLIAEGKESSVDSSIVQEELKITELDKKTEEIEEKSVQNDGTTSEISDISETTPSSKLDLSYGVIESNMKDPEKEATIEKREDKESYSLEEKEHDSLSEVPEVKSSIVSEEISEKTDSNKKSYSNETETQKSKSEISKSISSKKTTTGSSMKLDISSPKSHSSSVKSDISPSKSVYSPPKSGSSTPKSAGSTPTKSGSSSPTKSDRKSPRSPIDVKKRVHEILAETRGDRSPRMKDLYVTAYDVISPSISPELGSPIKSPNNSFGNEAEELLKKQLAIEQEIKQLQQQQKEQLPYVYMREIPNKPPPPYTPPPSHPPVPKVSIVPSNIEDINEITEYSAKIIHKAYISNNLDNVTISENTLNLISKNINKDSYKYIFDICKAIAKEHYKQFEKEKAPIWMIVAKKPLLAPAKPLDMLGLEKLMNKKIKEILKITKSEIRENAITKWSRKKRDHVDEILVLESHAEEADWNCYDKDELIVKDEVTNDIFNALLAETAKIFKEVMLKKSARKEHCF